MSEANNTAPAAPANPAPAKTEADAAAERAAVAASAIEADRERCKAIREHTSTGHEALAQKCMDEGTALADFLAAQTMAEKAKGPTYLEQRRKSEEQLAAVAPRPAGDPPAAARPDADAVPETDEAAKKAYAASAGLQREFGSLETYLAWAEGERGGWQLPERRQH